MSGGTNSGRAAIQLVVELIFKNCIWLRERLLSHYVLRRINDTLRFLATGRIHKDVEYTAVISNQSICIDHYNTSEAMYKLMNIIILKQPYTDLTRAMGLEQLKALYLSCFTGSNTNDDVTIDMHSIVTYLLQHINYIAVSHF